MWCKKKLKTMNFFGITAVFVIRFETLGICLRNLFFFDKIRDVYRSPPRSGTTDTQVAAAVQTQRYLAYRTLVPIRNYYYCSADIIFLFFSLGFKGVTIKLLRVPVPFLADIRQRKNNPKVIIKIIHKNN